MEIRPVFIQIGSRMYRTGTAFSYFYHIFGKRGTTVFPPRPATAATAATAPTAATAATATGHAARHCRARRRARRRTRRRSRSLPPTVAKWPTSTHPRPLCPTISRIT